MTTQPTIAPLPRLRRQAAGVQLIALGAGILAIVAIAVVSRGHGAATPAGTRVAPVVAAQTAAATPRVKPEVVVYLTDSAEQAVALDQQLAQITTGSQAVPGNALVLTVGDATPARESRQTIERLRLEAGERPVRVIDTRRD